MNDGHQTTAIAHAQALPPVTGTGTVTPLPATALTDKEFSTLQAQFALHGQTLSRLPGSVAMYCSRWGMVRHLPTVEDAHRFLEQVGGDL